ncbi:MAG: hypothetical protein WCI04_00020 [archaeon]
MAKKLLSSKSNYVPKRMINELEVERNGKTTYIDGADIYDGFYVKKGVKFGKGSTVKGGGEYRSYINNIYRNQSEQSAREGLMNFAREQGFEISDVENALQVYKYDTEENAWGENYYTKVAIAKMVDMISGKYAKGSTVKGGDYKFGYDITLKKHTSKNGTDIELRQNPKTKYYTIFVNGFGGTSTPTEFLHVAEDDYKYELSKYEWAEKRGVFAKGSNVEGMSNKEIMKGKNGKKISYANGGNMEGWGGTSESSQDGMLIGGTNAELTSNQQYGHGGSMGGWCYEIGGL